MLEGKPDKLQLLPAERAPTRRLVGDVVEEGVVAVEDVVQMGELVASLAEAAEAERSDFDEGGADAAYEMPDAPPEDDDLPDAPPEDDA